MRLVLILTLGLGLSSTAPAQIFKNGEPVTYADWEASDVHTADVNGDQVDDILTASDSKHTEDKIMYYRYGSRDPDSKEPEWHATEITSSVYGVKSLAAADIDGDGDTDILSALSTIGHHENGIFWYKNDNSSPGEGEWPRSEITSDGIRSIVTTDVDGDGNPDVVAASFREHRISWYQKRSDKKEGTSWERTVISTSRIRPMDVCASDIDGDGDSDVLSASLRDDTIALYRNGDASSGKGDGTNWSETIISSSADNAQAVFTADIDGDGDQDVLSASENDGRIAWYRNGNSSGGGTGTNWTRINITTSADGAKDVFAADIDEDGDQDVLSASFDDETIAWYRNEDSKGTSWSRIQISTAAARAQGVSAADVDGDGDQDVFSVSRYDWAITWYQNTLKDLK